MKKILLLSLVLSNIVAHAQFDMNVYNQKIDHMFMNNPAELGTWRNKMAGYSHQVFDGVHNASVWGYMSFGRYMHASLKDQEKIWHSVGLVLNTRETVIDRYENGQFIYSIHKAIGKKDSWKKVVLNMGVNGTFVNTTEGLVPTVGGAFSVNYRTFAAGVSVLNLNEPESNLLEGGFGNPPVVMDYFIEALRFRMGTIVVYPTLFARQIQGQDEIKFSAQSRIRIPKVNLFVGFGPDKGIMTGVGFSVKKKVNLGYFLSSNSFGTTHEWQVSIGTSRWSKEDNTWD